MNAASQWRWALQWGFMLLVKKLQARLLRYDPLETGQCLTQKPFLGCDLLFLCQGTFKCCFPSVSYFRKPLMEAPSHWCSTRTQKVLCNWGVESCHGFAHSLFSLPFFTQVWEKERLNSHSLGAQLRGGRTSCHPVSPCNFFRWALQLIHFLAFYTGTN